MKSQKSAASIRSKKAAIDKALATGKARTNIIREKGKTLRRGLLGWDTLRPGGKGSI